jgi:hypothetical protein
VQRFLLLEHSRIFHTFLMPSSYIMLMAYEL